jgi:hypothetical protein
VGDVDEGGEVWMKMSMSMSMAMMMVRVMMMMAKRDTAVYVLYVLYPGVSRRILMCGHGQLHQKAVFNTNNMEYH